MANGEAGLGLGGGAAPRQGEGGVHRRFVIEDEGALPVFCDLRLPAGRARGTVVVLHGFKGFKDWGFFPSLAEQIRDAGFAAVSMNASHSGVTESDRFDRPDLFRRASWSAYVADVERITERVVAGVGPFEGVPSDDLHLVGHSMGGGVALLHAASDSRVRSVVTLAAVSHPRRFDAEQCRAWRRDGFLPVPNARTGEVLRLGLDFLEDLDRSGDRLDIEVAAGRLACPALVVHGTEDETVPLREAHLLSDRIPESELVVVEGASHTFGEGHPFRAPGGAAYRGVVDRIRTWLAAPRPAPFRSGD